MATETPKDWSPQGGPPGSAARFAHVNKITANVESIPARPDREDITDAKEQEWNDSAFHYKVTLRKGPKRMLVYWSAGSGVPEPPKVDEILDNIAADAASFENARSFEDWAGEYGYDTDSRKAEKIYRTVGDQAKKLKQLLGDELYKELLWKTERE